MNDSAPAYFAPRPAQVPLEPRYARQRRFGADSYDAFAGTASADLRHEEECSPPMGEATVYRDGKEDLAQLRIDIGSGTELRAILKLHARGLRDLAARLLDAAHDIESNPAAVLAEVADAAGGAR
ncbi:hypothetical protein SAMN05518800_3210 [Variovorax sp. YR752]|uniref:hypothetical protein n=1 Tax=Variovorax sp. YR752 TaxID=1884383 RepID=UPI000BD04C2C|nr:hypothetical protein [Variovorax sp. YR752]SOD27646.1 hypothetical protein SAMN05518800_3210 [Variovorax sp. YR752]